MFVGGTVDSGDWLTRELAGDLFPTGTLDSLTLTAEEERFFDTLGNSPGLADSLTAEYPDDKQVILAAAKAAGLHKGGLRRTAFSMGDLSALQPPGPPSPPEGWALPPHSRAPKLESVPEGAPSFPGLDPASPSTSGLRGAADQPQGAFPFPSASTAPSYPGSPPGVSDALQPQQGHSLQGPPASGPQSSGFPWQPPPGLARSGSMPPAPTDQALLPEQERMLQDFADTLLKQHNQAGGSILPPVSAAFPPIPPGEQRPPAPGVPKAGPDVAAVGEAMRRSLGRSHSAVDLRSLSALARPAGLEHDLSSRVGVELTTPEGHTYHVGRLSTEDRRHKILRYRQKRHERNFSKRIKYQCRKTLADSRPRVRGRFARNSDAGAVLPHETKKAQAERAKRRQHPLEDGLLPKEEMYFAGSESMPDMGLGNPELGTADLLSSADLPPLPNYGSPGQLPGDPLEPLSDTGKSPALKYESLVGSPGDFLSLETPKGGMGAFAGDGDLDAAFASSATQFDQMGHWGMAPPEQMDGATSGTAKR